MKAVIIEDSETSRKCLQNLLKELCLEQISVIGSAGCYASGIEIIRTKKPDVVFLDMELPGGTGLDILAHLDKHERTFSVIVTSDWTKYSLLAIKEGVVDYLVKPIDIDDLMAAVEKAWLDREKDSAYERIQKNSLMLDFFEASHSPIPQIILRKNDKDILTPLHEIIYCESDLKYTIFHTTIEEHIRMRKNLSDYEEFLTAKGFIRINRSVLVNPSLIQKGKQDTRLTGKVVVAGNTILTVTPPYQKDLLRYLQLTTIE